MNAFTRRAAAIPAIACAALCAAPPVAAAPQKPREPLHRLPRMVHEYFVGRVRAVDRAIRDRIAALETADDARAYVKRVREQVRGSFGPWPGKTPLTPRVTGTVKRDTYRIEKVIFESRPGFPVTANLYIPTRGEPPFPGVVGTCGHSANGKASKYYQSFSQGLARKGYVVLIYDPISQGERLQYPGDDLKSRIGVGVREHLYAGNQQYLVGEFFGSWRAWDGIRALDYLLTRTEVDPKRIGVTGNSGGGTMTTWLAGVERRWTMAAPSCFVTTFRRNLENEVPADTEQCPPAALARGLDHADFLAAMAPKPIIILAKRQDFFDIRGSEEAHRRLRHIYALLGHADRAALFVGPGGHGYSRDNREAMYGFFNRAAGVTGPAAEPELVIEKDATLYCAPDGQVCRLDARTVQSFTRARSRELAKQRPANMAATELKKRVRQVLALPDDVPSAEPPDYRILQVWLSRGYPLRSTTYLVETEPGIRAVVYRLAKQRLRFPPGEKKEAVLYCSHQSADAELRDEPLVGQLLKEHPNAAFYACDVRGVGESRPGTCGGAWTSPYGADYFYAAHALMLGTPCPGLRTRDLLRVVDWLSAIGHEKIHVVARGWGTIPATFAAVLSDKVTRVTLKNAPTSYADIAESERYAWPLSCFVPGVLASFDLPDCYRVLRDKDLVQVEPLGPEMKARAAEDG